MREILDPKKKMIPVILCGGAGSRLWPMAGEKPFYRFFDQSLLEMSLDRLQPFSPVFVLGVRDREGVLYQSCLNWGGLKKAPENSKKLSLKLEKGRGHEERELNLLYEPEAKNTAVSIAFMCHYLNLKGNKGEIIGFFPADHLIRQQEKFYQAILKAISTAQERKGLTVLGVAPSSPCPDYGYIRLSKPLGEEVEKVVRFVEKPDLPTARSFLKEGSYVWNSGIFLAPHEVFIQQFKQYLPELWREVQKIKLDLSNMDEVYKRLQAMSFDKGVMEKAEPVYCVPCEAGWTDMGSWDRVSRLEPEERKRLNSRAHVISKDSHNNFVFSSFPENIALLGVQNKIVVHGRQGLLIMEKGESENTGFVAEQAKERSFLSTAWSAKEGDLIKTSWVKKPWGDYKTLYEGDGLKCKMIRVLPGHRLSCQSHKNRTERWLLKSGTAEVYLNGKMFSLTAEQVVFIPRGAKHRLGNSSSQVCEILEIQMGDSLAEEDIVRYEDDYGRS